MIGKAIGAFSFSYSKNLIDGAGQACGITNFRYPGRNCAMKCASSTANWHDLYRAALFEPDPAKLLQCIAAAEQALVARARELFQISGDHIDEEHAMDDAMYALHALRNLYQVEGTQAKPKAA
jgi:hypothetical protein